jgi:pimeloyl-ACP methyl ester carboxylesterase
MRMALTAALVALWAQSAFAAGIDKESVTLTTSDGVGISGYFVKGTAAKGPAVVLLHMLNRNKEDWDPIVEKYLLPQTGFSFLAIDLRGHGGSTKQGDRTLALEDFGAQDFNNMTRDVEAAVKWLKTRAEVDPDKIGIIGASIGANLAFVYAAQDVTIKAVALLSLAADCRGVRADKAITGYGTRPIFFAVASEDLPAARDVALFQKTVLGPEVTRAFDGNLQGTRMFVTYPLDRPLTEFLKKYLQ